MEYFSFKDRRAVRVAKHLKEDWLSVFVSVITNVLGYKASLNLNVHALLSDESLLIRMTS